MVHIRRETIKDMVAQKRSVTVTDLVEHFNVSLETIRRDLKALEEQGTLRRVYGGAVSIYNSVQEPAYYWRKEHNFAEKEAIAQKAADFVEDGDTILLSFGTTMYEVAKRIRTKQNITVITNSILNAMELANCPGITTYCLGGRVREGDMSTGGVLAQQNIKFFNVNKLITGIAGITPEIGMTDAHLEESELLRIYVNRAQSIIAVCDHSKFGIIATHNICPAEKIDHLITDSGASEDTLEPYRQLGVTVHTVTV